MRQRMPMSVVVFGASFFCAGTNHAQAISGLVFSAGEPETDGVRVSAKAIGSNLLLQL